MMTTESPKQHNSQGTHAVCTCSRYGYFTPTRNLQLQVEYLNKWLKILEAAKDNPALDDLVKKAEMVYELTK